MFIELSDVKKQYQIGISTNLDKDEPEPLPEYQLLTYVKNTGSAMLTLPRKLTNTTKYVLTAKVTNPNGGILIGENNKRRFFVSADGLIAYLYFYTADGRETKISAKDWEAGTLEGNIAIFEVGRNPSTDRVFMDNYVTVNGAKYGRYGGGNWGVADGEKVYMHVMGNSDMYEIYDLKVYEDNELVADYVPAFNQSSGYYCLLDQINNIEVTPINKEFITGA